MVWNEKSEEPLVPSLFSGRQVAEEILKFKACDGKVPVVGDAKICSTTSESLSRTTHASNWSKSSQASMNTEAGQDLIQGK